jgi:AbrB family looped-hinge helix DNA binding protein
MEVILMRKEVAIISVTRNGRITIPEEIRKDLKISNGDKLKVELQTEDSQKTILLTKL